MEDQSITLEVHPEISSDLAFPKTKGAGAVIAPHLASYTCPRIHSSKITFAQQHLSMKKQWKKEFLFGCLDDMIRDCEIAHELNSINEMG